MKIDNSLKSVAGKLPEENTSPRGNGTSATQSGNPGVQVDLSPLSTKLQSIEAGGSAADAANPARVNEIKQAIADGRFKVNPEVVADRLLATVQELIQAYRAS